MHPTARLGSLCRPTHAPTSERWREAQFRRRCGRFGCAFRIFDSEKAGPANFEAAVDATAQVDTMPHELIARPVKLQRLRVEKGGRDWAIAADGVAARAFKDGQIGKAIHT